MSPEPTTPTLIADLRAAGLSVAVHNDYRLNGERWTFWLFTHPDGWYVKGEGHTDEWALSQCAEALKQRLASEPAASVPVIELCSECKRRMRVAASTGARGAVVEEIAKRHEQAVADIQNNGGAAYSSRIEQDKYGIHKDRATLLALIGAKQP